MSMDKERIRGVTSDEVTAMVQTIGDFQEALEEIADIVVDDPEITLRYVIQLARQTLGWDMD